MPGVYAAVILAASAAVFLSDLVHTSFGEYFSCVVLLLAPAVAAVSAFCRAGRTSGRQRRTWFFLALAAAAWAVGETIWSGVWYVSGRVPFPSAADAAFLLFPFAACIALQCYPTPDGCRGASRRALDAILVTASLMLVFWQTVIGEISRRPSENAFTFGLSIAYPVTDLLVLSLVVLTLARTRFNKRSLWLVAAGCAALATADSLFVYLSATKGYGLGAVDLVYVFAFVLLALAAAAPDDGRADGELTAGTGRRQAPASFWPYIPVVLATTVVLVLASSGQLPTAPQLALAAVIAGLLLSRQYLVLRSNHVLTQALASREAELLHQAFHDRLTGLANRALFQDRLGHALELHRRDLRPMAVVFLDLDDFKLINDTLGHGAGDGLLSRVAQRLIGAVRHGDTVARLGGDEFAVLVEDGGDPVSIAAKIVDALKAPFYLAGQAISLGASVGVFELGPDDVAPTADLLLMKADTAMYAAKRSGKARIALYREGMSLTEVGDDRLARALTEALTNGEVALEYQPIIDLSTGRLHGLEALARWTHDGEPISPGVFVPLAERMGLITELTAYVLRRACAQIASWSAVLEHRLVSVAVNVPPSQITQPGFVARVAELVDCHRLAPGQLVLEITESGAFEDLATARTAIAALRAHGVGLSLDDFGVGQSSLAQLHNVELDSVKIDKSFIATLDTDPRQAHFLRALLRLSKDLNLQVIVEGVERPQQLAQLLGVGRPLAQGYLFSRPLDSDACLRLLRESALADGRPRRAWLGSYLAPVSVASGHPAG